MSDKFNVDELIKAMKERSEDISEEDREEQEYGEDYVNQLKLSCQTLLEPNSFQVGQLVKWKKPLKNKKLPRQNQPAVVVKVLAEPIPILQGKHDPGSTYFLEPLDIILGVIDEDGTFLTFYHDSRRFEPLSR